MNVSIIGSGNVATVLGRLIRRAGHTIDEVLSRNHEHAELLALELEGRAVKNLRSLSYKSNLYIIAVSDTAIAAVVSELRSADGIVVHTSGAVSKEVLKNAGNHFGVLYPLQSLRKELDKIPETPFLIDGDSEETTQKIKSFAQTLSAQVSIAMDEERLKSHLSAVIVSNFTNHLYALTEQYCIRERLDFGLLLPLINEVADRLSFESPKKLQTGPAIRGDYETIQKHLLLLNGNEPLHKIYSIITASIKRFYNID